MLNCTDTYSWSEPREGVASRISHGVRRAACLADRLATTVFAAMIASRQRVAERHLLATLDDRMLKDLGLNRIDVEREIHKRFWVD